MSEEKKSRKKQRSSDRAKKSFRSYIVIPTIFVLISMIFVIPVGKIALNYAVKTVHKAQQTLTIGYYDYTISDDNIIGEIVCEDKGLQCDLYCGINKLTLRNGAALSSEYGQLGEEDERIWGYNTTAFSALKNIEVGDIITINSGDDSTNYYVYKTEVNSEMSDDNFDVVFATFENNGAFSNYSDNVLYVYAVVEGTEGDLIEEETTTWSGGYYYGY